MIFAENGEAVETPVRNKLKTFFLLHLIENKLIGDDLADRNRARAGLCKHTPLCHVRWGGETCFKYY